jgi:hypothetical protein
MIEAMRGAFLAAFCAVLPAQPLEFNRDVRPILSDRCFSCHGPDEKNRQSKLRLDVESAARPYLGSGNAEDSVVWKRIVSTHPVQRMPPRWAGKDALPEKEREIIRRWLNEGARYEPHWAFIPPKRRPLPEVKNPQWVKNPIDRWILARLEREGLSPAPEASARVLRRRVALDLTGLPPDDPRPAESYEQFVERLLTSTRHAERMALPWLEAARYSDTNGYQTDGPRDMWRWRDWVIQAFQRNMAFDQFTIEQIAGDLLPGATMEQRLATGFHRNHRTSAEGGIVDEEFRVEYVADRAETTSTVWLGLTMGCARCHDHKYDPIRQRDFYSLFAFFNNVPEKGFVWNFGNEPPVMKAPLPEQQRRLQELDDALAQARRNVEQLESVIVEAQKKWERKLAKRRDRLYWTVADGLAAYQPLDDSVPGPAGKARAFRGEEFFETDSQGVRFDYRDPFTFSAWIKPESEKGAIVSVAEDYFEGSGHSLLLIEGKLRLHAIFRWTDLGMRVETADRLKLGEWQHVLVTYDGGMRASGVAIYVNGKAVETRILFDSMLWPIEVKQPLRIGAGNGLRFTGAIDEVRIWRRALNAREAATVALLQPLNDLAAKPPAARSAAERDQLRMAFLHLDAPRRVRRALANQRTAQDDRDRFYDSIPTVMVMQEREGAPRQAYVLQRGAYDAPGDPVSPDIPHFLPPLPGGSPPNRLALARWLVSKENPLTARVTVNRLWAMLFGTGLVKTTEDFGAQGEWPSHPELLDWLAVEFMESGWDVRHMLRLMVQSATYRQSSQASPELFQRDPENRLLARGSRFRLSSEMVRDQALAVSGLLVDQAGGPSVKPYQPPGLWQELHGGKGYQQDHGANLYRRSLYTYWKRTVAPPMMVNFDAATREVCQVRSSRTNTPLQALNLMNDVTFLEAARKVAERAAERARSPEARIRETYRLVLAREPSGNELSRLQGLYQKAEAHFAAQPAEARKFLAQGESPVRVSISKAELAALASVASLLLNLDETVTRE